jgi:hypothetical protein
MAVVRVSDVVVPARFTPYVQQITERKNRMVQAGIMQRNQLLDEFLAGGGLTYNMPSFQDLADDDERVGTDDPAQRIPEDGTGSAPNAHGKIGTSQEIAVRLNRNFSWSSMQLAGQLAGKDPMAAIGDRVGNYWSHKMQKAFIATLQGIFADNEQADPNGPYGAQNDLTVNISGGGYVAGVTDFSADAFIDALTTIGDSEDDLGLVVMHSIVYARAKKNNLIDFVSDSTNPNAQRIATFLGRRVIVDDSTPNPSAGIFHTWILGAGAFQLGVGTPDVATELERKPEGGQGAGQEILWNRVLWSIHPTGYAYIGTSPVGGPSNAATANNLAHLGSWQRVFPERKQIKIARLITRES